MSQWQGLVTYRETLAPAWWRLTVTCPDLSPQLAPGQFLLLRCGDDWRTCYLRRPLFPAGIASTELRFLLGPDPDPGYAWLLSRQPGDILDLLGPFGVGFPALPATRHLLLVSDSQRLGPLLAQMEAALQRGLAVTLALGGSRAATLYPPAILPPLVEYQAATLDGSLGHRGPITDLTANLLSWADAVFAVGSAKLYRTLTAQVAETRLGAANDYLFGLLSEQLLGCGLGACLSCVIETATGQRLTCLDGPVFDLSQLEL